MKRVKEGSNHEPCVAVAKVGKRAIKFHPYYFVLGYTFSISRFFQEVIYSMRCAPAQCSPKIK